MFYITVLFVMMALLSPDPGHAAGKVIAAIMSSDQPRYREAHRAFVKSLGGHGYTPATTEIILQVPNPDPLSWSNTIRKFNAYRPDLIVAYGAPAALVAMKEAVGIPVVSVDMYASERPQRGTCGVSSRVPMITLLKTMQDIRPFRKVGVMYNQREAGSHRQTEDVRKAALQLGTHVIDINVSSAAAVDSALTSVLNDVDVLVLTESGIVSRQFDRIIARAKARNIPVIATMPDAAIKGALVSLEINPQEQGQMAAEVAQRLLGGEKADALSLLAPRRIDMVINMKVAHDLGITIPFPVLSNATRILK